MRVSILLPSFRGRFLQRAITSVLAQTSSDYQLLVDHSPGAPLGERMYRLAEAATGEYLLWLCDDDELHPTFLEATTPYDTDVIYTDAVEHYADGSLGLARMRPWTLAEFRASPPCWISSLVRRSMWVHLGGHRTHLAYHDYDFWYRAFQLEATAAHVPEALWTYHRHPGQWTERVDRSEARAAFLALHPELGP